MKNFFIYFFVFFLSIAALSQEKIEVSTITIKGNKITKADIILRELSFKKGEVLSYELLEKKINDSKENITNLMLFNFTDISIDENDNRADIFIEVVERWYIWPYPIFELSERNFNMWWNEFKANNYSDFSRINYKY